MTRWIHVLAAATLTALVAVGGACGPAPVVEFGAILPQSGPMGIYGESIRQGVELAFDEIVEEWELPVELALRIEDSEGDPERARDLLRQMFREGVTAVIGGVTTGEALEMVSVADEYDRVLLSPSASSPELTGISRNFYRVFPSDALEGSRMGNFVTQTLEIREVMILAEEQPYARGIQSVFQSEFERYGGEAVEVIEFPPHTSDFSGLTDRVLTVAPDAVYLAAYADGIADMAQQLRQKGYRGIILTTSAFATPSAIARAGDAAQGVLLTQTRFNVASDDPLTRGFVDAYRERFGRDPDVFAAHGYDAMQALALALQEEGRAPSDFWKGMRSIRDHPGVTGVIQFDERGDAQKFPRIYIVNNGALLDYEEDVERRREEIRERLRQLDEERRRRTRG